jgi:hypothetical protein
MELLDRYLQAVGKYLPRKRRDDIVAELRANILEQAEEKQAELGRALTLDEEEVLLKQFGRPLVVAARYLPQQYLIGPTVFPYYIFALKTFIPLVLLAYTIANAAAFINEPPTMARILSMLAGYPMVAINVAVWITAIAAILEFTHAKYLKGVDRDWNPRKLPALEPKPVYNRSHTIFEVIGSGLLVLWLLAIPHNPFLLLGPGADVLKYIQPAPVWHTAYWLFLALLVAQWAIEIIALFRPAWRRARPALGLLGKAFAAAIFWYLLQTPQLFVVADTVRDVAKYQNLADNVNRGLTIGLRVGIIFFVLHVLWELGRMILGHSKSGVTAFGKNGAL